jgi:hypothetical protein
MLENRRSRTKKHDKIPKTAVNQGILSSFGAFLNQMNPFINVSLLYSGEKCVDANICVLMLFSANL